MLYIEEFNLFHLWVISLFVHSKNVTSCVPDIHNVLILDTSRFEAGLSYVKSVPYI